MSNVLTGKVGLIGDVHAEDELLEEALRRLAEAGIERVLCVGDLVDGTGDVDRVCALLAQHRVTTVRGNHDRWVLSNRFRDLPDATNRDQLAPATIAYLSSLPQTVELASAAGRVLLCHGLGSNDMAAVKPDDFGYALVSNHDLQSFMAGRELQIVLNGHTHRPMLRRFGRLTIINAGTLFRQHDPGYVVVDFTGGSVVWHPLNDSTAEPRVLGELMLDYLQEYSRYWKEPERYTLVRLQPAAGVGPVGHMIRERYTNGMWLNDDITEEESCELTRRMLDAGVEVISLEEARRRTPLWGADDPQRLLTVGPEGAQHVRLSDGRFQRIVPGPERSLFIGFEYAIVNDRLAQILAEVAGDQVSLPPAVVYDPATRANIPGYCEVLPQHELSPRAMRTRTYPQVDIWHFAKQHIFVSPRLRDAVLAAEPREVSVLPGYKDIENLIQEHW